MPMREGILLIGGSGFLGLALAGALTRAGREVHALSRNTQPGKAGGIIFHRGSQDDADIVLPLLETCGTVVHLASTTTPGSSARRPVLDAEENLLPAARLIEIMSDRPPERLLFMSSGGAVYGNPEQLPVVESVTPQALSYYAAGKIALESLFNSFSIVNDVSLAVVRPSNIYGPGQPLRGGFGLIRTLLDKAKRNAPLEMWGDGNAIRDYLYIDDTAEACMSLVETRQATGVFNLGSGLGASIADLIDLVGEVSGRELEVIKRPARSTDVRAIILDNSRIQRATTWRPRVDLQEGVKRTWKWVQEILT